MADDGFHFSGVDDALAFRIHGLDRIIRKRIR